MRVLCVAEKPSISKSITQILSGGQFNTTESRLPYIKNYKFDYPQTNAFFTVTCVTGHLTGNDFPDTHRKWGSCDAFDLFDAPVETFVPDDKKAIEANLITQARQADMLMIWTDCDREGEHIGMEIANVCRKVKRNIEVKRARFSAIIAQQIHRAAQNPVDLDRAQADSVDARIMLDLKVGAAFTRMQTQILQNHFARLAEGKNVVSYGPCQFPTLGFVVQKYNLVKSFVSEPFWYIFLSLARDGEETVFTWKRGHLFDRAVAIAIYDFVLSDSTARVTKVTKKETKKWKPLPLTTVELQKAGSRLLRLAPKKVLDIAEKLYQQGFLSYPRTETDQFDPQFDFMSLVQKQTVDPAWGNFATELTQGASTPPRKGKNNDKAHPPIHPTAHAGNLAGDEKKVYEFITRRFLACCSKDATGWQTTVDVVCGEEFFSATGLVVLERNYLDVYPYDKWVGHSVPDFEEGEEFQPSVCELRDGQTSKPNFLTEADLVTLMDKNGIGTDATIAQHIETIINRDYVIEKMEGNTKYLIPSKLGIGLVEGYNQIGLETSLSKPQLRRETERRMVQVCEGIKGKADMLEETIAQYKDMYVIVKREFEKVVSSVRRYLEGGANNDRGNDGGGRGGGGGGGRGGGGGDEDENDGGGGDNRGANDRRGRGGRTTTRGRGASVSRGNRNGADTAAIMVVDSDDDLDHPPNNPSKKPSSTRRKGPPVSNGTTIKLPSRQAPLTNLSAASSSKPPSIQSKNIPLRNNSSNDVQCDCGIAAKQGVHTSESASKGQKYWECGNNKACNFYRRDVSANSTPPVIPAKRSYSEPYNTNTMVNTRMCKCNEPAIQLSAKTAANAGRVFWKCNAQKEGGCGFFAWDDEPESTSRTQTSAGGSQNPDECYKCHQIGHWASNCPNQGDSNNNKRPRSFGPTGGAGVTCYKCNEPGHVSTSCPNGNMSRSNSGRGGGGDTGTCFKCGKSGHWSNACTGDDGTSVRGKKAGRGRQRISSRGKRGRGGKKSAFGAPDDY